MIPVLLKGREMAIKVYNCETEKEIVLKVRSLSRLAKLGKIPARKIGSRWFFFTEKLQPENMPEVRSAFWLRRVK